ncbi:hypothetical protein GCM10025734_01440 [Kitasatospora paranensis]
MLLLRGREVGRLGLLEDLLQVAVGHVAGEQVGRCGPGVLGAAGAGEVARDACAAGVGTLWTLVLVAG